MLGVLTMSRGPDSPFRHDRAEIRCVLEADGLEAARARWPKDVVDPIARVLGLTSRYRPSNGWDIAWNPLLGTKPDGVIAGELGIPLSTVSVQRRKLGIPVCDAPIAKAIRDARIAERLVAIPDDELMQPLNIVSQKYALSGAALTRERKRRGLQPVSNRGHRLGLNLTDLKRVAIVAIRRAYPLVSLEAIADAVGCTKQRVDQILYAEQDKVTAPPDQQVDVQPC